MANSEFRIPTSVSAFALCKSVRKFAFCLMLDALCLGGTLSATEESAPVPETMPDTSAAVERFSTLRTEFFSISAERAEAANHAAELIKEVEAYFVKTPRLWKKYLPSAGSRIGIELFSRPDIMTISRNGNGTFTLFLSEAFFVKEREGEGRRILVRAMLEQMFPAGTSETTRVPAWLVFAVADESRIGSVPGRRIFLKKTSRTLSAVSPQRILSADADALARDDTLRKNALWFLRGVPDVAPFLMPGSAEEVKLLMAFPQLFEDKKFNAEAMERFWSVRLRNLVAEAPGGIDLPEESRRAFDEALLFLVAQDGEDVRILGCDLVDSRFDLKVRDLVSARLATFADGFRHVNPIWHNAFAEYGLFLEMFGNPDVSAETLSAQWSKAIFAREAAIELSEEVHTILQN